MRLFLGTAPGYAQRTLELSAQLSGIRDCWRKLFPQVCGG